MKLIIIKSWILIFIINIICIKGQTYIAPGVFGDDLFNIINDNYKTSTTLGYNNARDIMYSEIDIKVDVNYFHNLIAKFIVWKNTEKIIIAQ